jgi:hypothetical protein
MRPLSLFPVAAAALAGCAAQVSVTVDDTVVGTANRATVVSVDNGAAVQSVQLKVGNQNYTVVPTPVNLGLRMPGEYTAVATVWFKRLFSGQLESASGQALFRVREAEGCFSFNDPHVSGLSYTGSDQAWRAGGFKRVLNGQETDVGRSAAPAMAWDDDSDGNHRSPADYLGGLRVVSSRNDQPPGEVPAYDWYFDVHSPALAAYPVWQGINGLSFSVRGFAANTTALKVQGIFRVRRPDGTETTVAEGTDMQRVFYDVSNDWVNRTIRMPLPPGYVVLGAIVRFHGVATAPRENIRIDIDAICPLP